MNAREAVPIQIMLEEMGHKQPPTSLVTDNSIAEGIANKKVKQQKTKAMDMHFYWLQDRATQDQFDIQRQQGKPNLGDYYTKHHPSKHDIEVRPTYVHESK